MFKLVFFALVIFSFDLQSKYINTKEKYIKFNNVKPFKIGLLGLYGAIAQLGERLNGIQEVRGSIPRSSTT